LVCGIQSFKWLHKYMQYKKVAIHKVDLKKLLKKANLSLRELSKRAGINYEYLIRAEKGYFIISEEKWINIKQALEQAMLDNNN